MELQEQGYSKPEEWTAHVGSSKANWKLIPAGSNVTHTFVVKPKRVTDKSAPFYGYPAVATYAASAEGDRISAYSNDVGAFHIYQRGELAKRTKSSTSSWILVLLSISFVTVAPLGVWRYQQKRAPYGISKK